MSSTAALIAPAMNFDVEVFPNFAMVGFRDYQNGAVRLFGSNGLGGGFGELRRWWPTVENDFLFVGFNNLAYDNAIVRAIVKHRVDDPGQLYAFSQDLIGSRWARCNQIGGEISLDLLAIAGGQMAKIGSLKECGIKLDFPRLRELPFRFDTVLGGDDMDAVADYNIVDLGVTAAVTANFASRINGRVSLSMKYGAPAYNRHDAGLAETLLKACLFGDARAPYPKDEMWVVHGEQLVDGFHYRNPELVALVDRLRGQTITYELVRAIENNEIKKEIKGRTLSESVTVDGVGYRLGAGGLHSDDGPGWFEADNDYLLRDFDVTSFYPALILNDELVRAHLPRDEFLTHYEGLMQARLDAVATGDHVLGDALKVAINAVFGKTKGAYSWLLDPVTQLGITVRGQLTLLLFVELVADLDGCSVVSANTDGFTVRMRRTVADEASARIRELAAARGYRLKEVDYQRLCRRDINNFVALGVDGKVKAKGSYGYSRSNLDKKAVNRVVVDAVQARLLHDIPVEQTIRACRDITSFVDYFKASKGYVICDESLDYGGIARWYLAEGGVRLQKRRIEDGKRIQLVGTGARVIADLPVEFPADVDYDAYIKAAEALVKAIVDPEPVRMSTIPHAELSLVQREVLAAALAASEPDLDRCRRFDLVPLHDAYAANGRGNRYDTLKSLIVRLWLHGRGELSLADLDYLAGLLDEPVGQFAGQKRGKLTKLCGWVAENISPFPLPVTVEDQLDRALIWARENVEPAKARRPMWHRSVLDTRYVSKAALGKYRKTGALYPLACSICAASVKHDAAPDKELLLQVLRDAIAAPRAVCLSDDYSDRVHAALAAAANFNISILGDL